MSVELKVGNRVTVEVIELRSDNPGMNDYWVVNEIISVIADTFIRGGWKVEATKENGGVITLVVRR